MLSSQIIKQTAANCGFGLCGIAKAAPLVAEKERFGKALAQNYHAKKEYLERDVDKRFNPLLLLDDCKSVVVCGFNYNTEPIPRRGVTCYAHCHQQKIKISRYAWVKDYHVFMKEKLEKLAQDLQTHFGAFNYKTTIDSSVISEKGWAVQAGVGYYGHNGVIQTALGSFVFLGILLIDKEIDKYDKHSKKTCKNCKKCMDACPTKAIAAPYCVDSNLCISNINLNKKETDFTQIAKYAWLIGCDVCQEVCPNNIHAQVNEEAVAMRASFAENQQEIIENLTPELFEKYFKDTVIYQYKYEGLKRRLYCVDKHKVQTSCIFANQS